VRFTVVLLKKEWPRSYSNHDNLCQGSLGPYTDRLALPVRREVFARPAAKCRGSANGAGLRACEPANPRRTRTSARLPIAHETFCEDSDSFHDAVGRTGAKFVFPPSVGHSFFPRIQTRSKQPRFSACDAESRLINDLIASPPDGEPVGSREHSTLRQPGLPAPRNTGESIS